MSVNVDKAFSKIRQCQGKSSLKISNRGELFSLYKNPLSKTKQKQQQTKPKANYHSE